MPRSPQGRFRSVSLSLQGLPQSGSAMPDEAVALVVEPVAAARALRGGGCVAAARVRGVELPVAVVVDPVGALGRHRGVARVGAEVALVAVAGAVAVAIDAEALPGSERDAGEGDLLAGGGAEVAQRAGRDQGKVAAVGLEEAAAGVAPAGRFAAHDALRDQLDVSRVGLRGEQRDAVDRRGAARVRRGGRHLLADGRLLPRVEGEQELLELALLGGAEREDGRLEEEIHRPDRAVVQEAEAAHLVARGPGTYRPWCRGFAGAPP